MAARTGAIFFNFTDTNNRMFTRAVATSNGATLWTFDLGPIFNGTGVRLFGPAYANGRVSSMTPTNNSSATPLLVVNASTGAYLSTATYDTQGSSGSVVTPVGDELFYSSGYFGNVVFAANAVTGSRLWRTALSDQYSGYVMQGESVAVDQNYVYFFSAGSLVVLGRDGSIVKSIENPFFSQRGLSYSGEYVGAPMLDGSGRIFTFSDNYSEGKALPIAAYSLNSDKAIWRSGFSYTGQPAVHGNQLYAIRSSSTIVDVVDTATGVAVRSYDVGGTENLTSNVVATDSHLFVANSTTTFAIDLTRSGTPVVWRTSFGGRLAITPEGYLVISTATGLHAVKLR
ncbi:MAG: PQQ-binding-like beta-propeller repeat protein [Novosphingobium sp.]